MTRKTVMLLICLAFAAATWAGEAVPLRSHPDSAGWPSLFAEDLSNAVYPKGVWSFRKSELAATEDHCIWSQKEYERFVLDLEFKTSPGSKGGVIVYCTDTANWMPRAVEIPLQDDYAKRSARSTNFDCGGVFGHVPPKKQMVKKAGEWNRMTISCIDSLIVVVLNGERVVEIDMKQWIWARRNPDGSLVPGQITTAMAELPTKGHIGLQGAQGGKAQTYFRNIKIKQLTE
jgi:hypothetical protein